jgi:secondary thiamine-phosphate synthase enzyme
MKKHIITIKTTKKDQIIDITNKISNLIKDCDDQIITITVAHTTAGITVNENYDPDVKIDMIYSLNKISPDYSSFRHSEGNSDAHIKATLVGRSEQIAVIDGKLDLGTWEGIYFCEFDGPRTRDIWLYI